MLLDDLRKNMNIQQLIKGKSVQRFARLLVINKCAKRTFSVEGGTKQTITYLQ